MRNKKIFKNIIILVTLIIVVFTFVYFIKPKPLIKIHTKINNQDFVLDIANTNTLKEKGLGGRDGLSSNQGMLFVFQEPAFYTFWMKDMKFAIDIIWLDSECKVVSIAENILPATYPKSFTPENLSQYVLEVASGVAKENRIEKGSVFNFCK